MTQTRLNFSLGDLDLILSPRLDQADFNWMRSMRERQQFTGADDIETLDRAAAMLLKCARDHSPNLTKEKIMAAATSEGMAAVAVALLQVSGIIPINDPA